MGALCWLGNSKWFQHLRKQDPADSLSCYRNDDFFARFCSLYEILFGAAMGFARFW